jgi:hypothetical protein
MFQTKFCNKMLDGDGSIDFYSILNYLYSQKISNCKNEEDPYSLECFYFFFSYLCLNFLCLTSIENYNMVKIHVSQIKPYSKTILHKLKRDNMV